MDNEDTARPPYAVHLVPLSKLYAYPFVSQINKLIGQTNSKPYTPKMVKKYAQTYTGRNTYIACLHDWHQVIGICRIYPISPKSGIYEGMIGCCPNLEQFLNSQCVCYLSSFIIAPDFRRRGFGKVLLRIIMRNIQKTAGDHAYKYLTLFVSRHNKQAVGLYATHNFSVFGNIKKDEYDDYLMISDLSV